jgi:hypothetical protein
MSVSGQTMTILGALSASITAALGFGDLVAVFGEYEPVARFCMVFLGGGLGFALGQSNPGNGR